ncbi:hypothetical protein LMG33818_001861 [Halomonadaceae bacterium LMG 33818]|uniref:AAA family ATPase n=1 Tax=Cernens ardua TaxID=3402176 RepID=UPI003EDB998A
MLTTLAIANYRSLLDLKLSLGPLTVIVGQNGSGKSNLYKALRLLADTSRGESSVINALAMEGGLPSTFWAGPNNLSAAMKRGDVPIEATSKRKAQRLKLGFASDDLGYAVTLGYPAHSKDQQTPVPPSAFKLDPEIKKEIIFGGPFYRPNTALVDRSGYIAQVRDGRKWQLASSHIPPYTSMFDQLSDPKVAPEVFHVRHMIRQWRFYDHFRTDQDAPARKSSIGTRTPVLSADGRDLAAALQTIIEIGDHNSLNEAIDDAFPGSYIDITRSEDGLFTLNLYQPGMLRPLTGAELSDGTLRFILWVAALLTPRPPALMVLNEPETSLHPDLLPALARLIVKASEHSQVWVISHAESLVETLKEAQQCDIIELYKENGQTLVRNQGILNTPAWHWPNEG